MDEKSRVLRNANARNNSKTFDSSNMCSPSRLLSVIRHASAAQGAYVVLFDILLAAFAFILSQHSVA
jgi:hypothetical protein